MEAYTVDGARNIDIHHNPEDMDVANETGIETGIDLESDACIDVGIDTGIDADDLYNDLSQKHEDKTEDQLYAIYMNNPNNAHLVTSPWKRLPSNSVSHSTLWNKERDCEEVVLFVGVCNFTYLQDGGNYNKVTWASTEGKSYLSITFFDEYREKISEWERVWKSGSGNLEWTSAKGFTFKVAAFKKEEGESSKVHVSNKRKKFDEEYNGNLLTSDQLSRCNKIQIVDEHNSPIDVGKIDNGDLVVVKSHVRYWRNLRTNMHGINKHLVGVKLLKKLEVQVSHLSSWQKDIF